MKNPLKPSQSLFELLTELEGLRLEAYRDAGGVMTIGVGHTGPDVTPGLAWTAADAQAALAKDVLWASQCVNLLVRTQLNQNQFDALVSFVFNIGQTAFKNSTMLYYLNDGELFSASQQFTKWAYVDGVVSKGLEARRAKEQALFLTRPASVR